MSQEKKTDLTAQAKRELASVVVTRQEERMAELTSIIRFAATTPFSLEEQVLELELNDVDVAQRAMRDLRELFTTTVVDMKKITGSKSVDVRITVTEGVPEIMRRTGLVLPSGQGVLGFPPPLVSGSVAQAEAVWRGAFLVRGSLAEPGRTSALEVVCPDATTAYALVGFARRMDFKGSTKDTRGIDRAYFRDGDTIGALLSRMGAHRTRLVWDEQRKTRETNAAKNRLANFDDANQRRSAQAAVEAAARVERAMEILGDDVSENLAEAGRLRVMHRHASLEKLGKLADKPISKDSIAGRIRRLLSKADERAHELGIPDTQGYVNGQSDTENSS